MGDELLVPNLDLVPPNTISLMLTNQPFIEAYMVGAEPTSSAASCSGANILPTSAARRSASSGRYRAFRPNRACLTRGVAETLKDIQPVHEWQLNLVLGDTANHRGASRPASASCW